MSNDYRRFFTILIYSCMYMVLCFVPLLGPLIIGFYIGKRVKGIKEGLLMALISGITGFFILSFFIFPYIYKNIFLGTFVILWQFISIVFIMIGSIFGCMLYELKNMTYDFGYRGIYRTHGRDGAYKSYNESESKKGEDIKTYVICPICGESNDEYVRKCKSCGAEI